MSQYLRISHGKQETHSTTILNETVGTTPKVTPKPIFRMKNGTTKTRFGLIHVTQPTQVDGTPTASFGGAARMAVLSGLLALGGTLVSCDKATVEPTEVVDPNALKPGQVLDTPENKAAFMTDLKPTVLSDGIGILDFDVVYSNEIKNYLLLPKPKLDFQKAAQQLELDAKNANVDVNNSKFGISFATDGGGIRIAWGIPYDVLKSKTGEVYLNSPDLNQFATAGEDVNKLVAKGTKGFLSLASADPRGGLIQWHNEIRPYYFGK